MRTKRTWLLALGTVFLAFGSVPFCALAAFLGAFHGYAALLMLVPYLGGSFGLLHAWNRYWLTRSGQLRADQNGLWLDDERVVARTSVDRRARRNSSPSSTTIVPSRRRSSFSESTNGSPSCETLAARSPRSHVTAATADFRAPAVPPDELWRVVEDPSTTATPARRSLSATGSMITVARVFAISPMRARRRSSGSLRKPPLRKARNEDLEEAFAELVEEEEEEKRPRMALR